jgi:hypothetical protein
MPLLRLATLHSARAVMSDLRRTASSIRQQTMATLSAVENRTFATEDFALEKGGRLAVCELAYETHGTLAPSVDDAILVVHGYTSSGHVAGVNAVGKEARGGMISVARADHRSKHSRRTWGLISKITNAPLLCHC